jgi:hypothetical protein
MKKQKKAISSIQIAKKVYLVATVDDTVIEIVNRIVS